MSHLFKLSFIMICLSIVNDTLISQQTNQSLQTDTTKTLFSKVKINTLGIYMAPEWQYAPLTNQFSSFGGGSLMLSFNTKFDVGVNVITNQRNFTPTNLSSTQSLRLHTRMVGLKLMYNLAPHKLVNVTVPLVVGGGVAYVDSVNAVLDNDYGHHNGNFNRRNNISNTTFMYVQPGVNVDINLFKYAKFFVGAGYRINLKTKNGSHVLTQLDNGQLSGVVFQGGLKLGIFGYNMRKAKTDESN